MFRARRPGVLGRFGLTPGGVQSARTSYFRPRVWVVLELGEGPFETQ